MSRPWSCRLDAFEDEFSFYTYFAWSSFDNAHNISTKIDFLPPLIFTDIPNYLRRFTWLSRKVLFDAFEANVPAFRFNHVDLCHQLRDPFPSISFRFHHQMADEILADQTFPVVNFIMKFPAIFCRCRLLTIQPDVILRIFP